jgi:TonB family protein
MRIGFRAFCHSLVLTACLSVASAGEARPQEPQPAAGEEDRVYRQSEVDEKAVLDRKSWRANIPKGYRCGERQGTVRLRVVLHKSGEVADVAVSSKSNCEEFDRTAIKAARKVKFTPAKRDGVAVSQYSLFEYNYRIW